MHSEKLIQENQSDKIPSEQRWQMILEGIKDQDLQRSELISHVLNGLEDLVQKKHHIEELKSETILTKISKLEENAKTVQQICVKGPSKQNWVRKAYEQKKLRFIRQYEELTDKQNKNFFDNINKKLIEVTNTSQKNSSKFIKKTQLSVLDLIKQTKVLSDLISKEKEKRQKALINIQNELNLQIEKVRQCGQKIIRQKKQSQKKLQEMISDFDKLVESAVNEEIENGQISYDCLVKLFEDTYSKMEENLL